MMAFIPLTEILIFFKISSLISLEFKKMELPRMVGSKETL
jgi:hypothetical protein